MMVLNKGSFMQRVMDEFSDTLRGRTCIMVLLVTMMLLQLAVTQAAEAQRQAGVLIEELRSADAAGDEAGRHQARERLSALGESAIPSIREAVKNSTGAVRLELLFAIGGIEGDDATSALLELAATDSDEAVPRGGDESAA